MLALTTAERVAKRQVSTGVGVRPQPRRDIHRQQDAAVRCSRQRHPGQGTTQPGDINPSLVEPAVQSPVSAAVFGREREVDQRPYRPVRAQQGVA